jgi:hypothetical protein
MPPGSPGFRFGRDPRDRPRERFPEWVYWLPYLSLILLTLYLDYYRHYLWVLLAAAFALSLLTRSPVFVVGWCVLTGAYLVVLGAFLLVVRVVKARARARWRARRH